MIMPLIHIDDFWHLLLIWKLSFMVENKFSNS